MKPKKQDCACGAELPHHLAKLGLTGHCCSCGREYIVKDSKFVLVLYSEVIDYYELD